ncbi:MAG: hypothetical protein ABIJ28_00735 [Patescibacteria group bacterium]
MKNINFKKLVIVLSIIIVLNLFFNYGIKTFYDGPKFEDFCTKDLTSRQYTTQQDCESVGGFWTSNPDFAKPAPMPDTTDPKIAGWCDIYYQCQQEFDDVRSVYNRNVFLILIALGIISIVLGFVISQSEAVALGFSFGGILSLIIGTIRFWSDMDDYLRFVILGLALAILIWIGIKKLKDRDDSVQP